MPALHIPGRPRRLPPHTPTRAPLLPAPRPIGSIAPPRSVDQWQRRGGARLWSRHVGKVGGRHGGQRGGQREGPAAGLGAGRQPPRAPEGKGWAAGPSWGCLQRTHLPSLPPLAPLVGFGQNR